MIRNTYPYLAILRARFRARIQYRAAAFAGVLTQFFFGCIRIMIIEAFYRSGGEQAVMSFREAVAYIWLGQAFLGLLPWNADPEVETMISDGNVAFELLRPIDLYNHWFVRAIAWRVANTLLRCIPILLIVYLAVPRIGLGEWALMLPPDLVAALGWLLSMVFAVFLGAAFTSLSQLALFWTISGRGINALIGPLITVGSGMVIPLPLFPDWARPIFLALPFHAMVDAPYRIYCGNITGNGILLVLVQQIVWTVVLVVGGRQLMKIGRRRIVVQGG